MKVLQLFILFSTDLCQNPIDLLFVLDSSESVGADNWEKVLNFTKKVASKFDVKYTRFGIIQYHSVPEVPIVLSSFHDNTTLDNAIGSIFYKPGSTRTDLAITKAAEVFNKAPLRKASRVAIFVVGGRSTDLFVSQGKSINATDLIKEPATNLQAAHVAVYAASVSEGLPAKESMLFKAELNILTSNPPLDHIFESTTYDDLLSAKPAEVAKKTCIGEWKKNALIFYFTYSYSVELPYTLPCFPLPASHYFALVCNALLYLFCGAVHVLYCALQRCDAMCCALSAEKTIRILSCASQKTFIPPL